MVINLKKHFVIILFCLFVWLNDGQGQDILSQPASRLYKVPSIGNLKFFTALSLPSPFIDTHLQNSLGYGQSAKIKIPVMEINGEPLYAITGSSLYTNLVFEYQYRVQEWLGVWSRIGVLARLGTEAGAILSQGITAATNFELGWLFRLHRGERHLLSTSFSLNNSSSTFVDIYSFVKTAIDSGGITPDNKIVKDSPTIISNADLRYALALNDFIGLTALVKLSYGESMDRKSGNEMNYSLGGLFHFNLDQKTDAPIGVAAGYQFSALPDNEIFSSEEMQSIILKITYTGRPDLDIGVEMTMSKAPVKGLEENATYYSTMLSMFYYF